MSTAAEYCTLCHHRPATGRRHASGIIAVCPECAAQELPGLLADALPLPLTADAARAAAREAELRYWRALALRLIRERRPC